MLDTDTGTRGSSTVHRQITKIGGSTAAAILDLLNTAPTGAEYAVPVRPIGGIAGTPAGSVLTVQGAGSTGTAVSITNLDFDSGAQNLTAAAQTVSIGTNGGSTTTIDISGTYVGVIVIEVSFDTTTWDPISIVPFAGGAPITNGTLPSAATGTWVVNGAGSWGIRARMSAYTSGTATLHLRSSAGNGATVINGPLNTDGTVKTSGAVPNQSIVTITAASGSVATWTTGTPGAGLFAYLTSISITAYAAAAVTGVATPILTTAMTNVTGAPIFTFATAKAIGTVETQQYTFSPPLKGTAAATAITLPGTATTGIIWRINGTFYFL